MAYFARIAVFRGGLERSTVSRPREILEGLNSLLCGPPAVQMVDPGSHAARK
jgi:hypothetical protein